MSSDIRLEENGIVMEGDAIFVHGSDLLLDQVARRPGTDPASFRRALVHDFNDDLTINFNTDYPGGVNILGNVKMPGEVSVKEFSAIRATTNVLTVKGALEIQVPDPTVPFTGDPMTSPIHTGRSTINLGDEIKSLRDQIVELQEQIKALNKKKLG